MAGFAAMTSAPPARPTHVMAESIRRQLGTDTVVLITPGEYTCAVVVAPTPDHKVRLADAAAEQDPESGRPEHSERLAYSVAEAASVLGLSRSLIYDQLRTGRLCSLKVGGRRIITREQIDKFLAGMSQELWSCRPGQLC